MPGAQAERKESEVAAAASAQTRQAVDDVTRRLTELGYPRCAARVEFLRDCGDFEAGEAPLSLASAQSFLDFVQDADFWRALNKIGKPAIGLFPKGTLSAEWRTPGSDKYLLIEFLSRDAVSFAMTGPDPAPPGDGRAHFNGRGARAEVIKTLRAHGVTEWSAA